MRFRVVRDDNRPSDDGREPTSLLRLKSSTTRLDALPRDPGMIPANAFDLICRALRKDNDPNDGDKLPLIPPVDNAIPVT